MMKKKIIRNIASIGTLTVGVGLAIGIPLGLYFNRDKSIDLGSYKTNYVFNNQSKDQKIAINPTYDRKEKGLQYQWYVKVDNNQSNSNNESSGVTRLTDSETQIPSEIVNPLEGYQLIPNANSRDFTFTEEMMQLVWMQQNPNQNFSFKCKVIKGELEEVTDEIKVFLPKQVVSITQPMLETFMFSVGSFFTPENIQTDVDQTTGVINKGSDLFKQISEYFLLNTEYPNQDIIQEIKLSPSRTREQNPDDYIVDFDFKLNPEYTWIKTLYSNDEISSYFVDEDSNVLHLDNVNIQQNLYTTTDINYSQDDLADFVQFVDSSYRHLNFYIGDKQTLSNNNLVEPFRSISINSQIPNPLNVIESIDFTVQNKTKSNPYYEFVFHLNPEYKLNLTAQSNDLASINYDEQSHSLTISNIKLGETNKIIQPNTTGYFGTLVGWNITKTSLDNVVNELLELYDGQPIPGEINSSEGIWITNKVNPDYFEKFSNLLKVNGLENANEQIVEGAPFTVLNQIIINNYKKENNRKTLDISFVLSDINKGYYFAKNGFDVEQNKSGVWYEYSSDGTTLTIHNFPIDNFQVNNYWDGSIEMAEWINKYLNFNLPSQGLDLTDSLNSNFYNNILGIPKEYVEKVEIKLVRDVANQEISALDIKVDKTKYFLENVRTDQFGDDYTDKETIPITYDYDIVNNDEIRIALPNVTIYKSSDDKVVNVDIENLINFIKEKANDSSINISSNESGTNYFTISSNKNSEYFDDLCQAIAIDKNDVLNFELQITTNSSTQSCTINGLYINLNDNVHNFWNTNEYYQKNGVSVLGYKGSADSISWDANLETNWKFELLQQKLDINSEVIDELYNQINDYLVGKYTPDEWEQDLEDPNKISHDLNSAIEYWLSQTLDYNATFDTNITNIEINDKQKPNISFEVTLNSSDYIFSSTENIENVTITNSTLKIENLELTNIDIPNVIDVNETSLDFFLGDPNKPNIYDIQGTIQVSKSNNLYTEPLVLSNDIQKQIQEVIENNNTFKKYKDYIEISLYLDSNTDVQSQNTISGPNLITVITLKNYYTFNMIGSSDRYQMSKDKKVIYTIGGGIMNFVNITLEIID